MLKDYYETLELPRNASHEQICLAFQRLSLKWHPDRNPNQKVDYYPKFCEVCESFEVLSNPQLKGIYDMKGIQTLKKGYYEGNELIGCYEFMGNPEEIFELFFGTNDFYQAIIQFENEYSNFLNEKNKFQRNPPENIEISVEVSLLDLYKGKSLIINYNKTIINKDGITTQERNIQKTIILPRGYDPSNKIVFPQEGNEQPGFGTSDLVVMIIQQSNEHFKRKDLDLFYTQEISLLEALIAKPFTIKSLDDRELLVPITDIINPETVIKLEEEGMIKEDRLQPLKGNLYISFHISFPTFITLDDKKILQQILQLI